MVQFAHHPELVEGEEPPACAKPLQRRQGEILIHVITILRSLMRPQLS